MLSENQMGSLSGLVTDQSGSALPGVTVSAQATGTAEGAGTTRDAISEADGRYRIVELPAGAYAVSIALTGFDTFHADAAVDAGSDHPLNASLRLVGP